MNYFGIKADSVRNLVAKYKRNTIIDDTHNFSNVLRLKNQNTLFQGGDPKARSGQCWSPWCRNWVEDLPENNRCNEEKCTERLFAKALKQKRAVYFKGTYFGDVSYLLEEPKFEGIPEHFPEPLKRALAPDTVATKDDMCCVCHLAIKRPGEENCVPCHLSMRSDQHNRRRDKVSRAKTRTRNRSRLKHRGLKGLSKVKL